ncbi:hypothetical protein OsJ_14721 [Oryza sativa Japonica Group]|uniref:Uncharacterized protein n=1 Tax=Oryza sativa subsp. japonica TaxID=39947 RepID=B9FF24_ORYSJ|nr:hypothetical protein OsJ_14721 [Oryza sativa Japonica Group]
MGTPEEEVVAAAVAALAALGQRSTLNPTAVANRSFGADITITIRPFLFHHLTLVYLVAPSHHATCLTLKLDGFASQ